MSYQILSKTTVFNGYALNVEKLHVRLPDARERDYDLVRHVDSVTILPIDDENNIWFVTQYRMGSEKVMIELPAGTMDDNEKPLDCAMREVREEIGMAAENMQHLGSIYLAPGYSSEINHIFLATKLYAAPLDQDEDEFLQIEKIHFSGIKALVESGRLQDGKSLAALYMAGDKLA